MEPIAVRKVKNPRQTYLPKGALDAINVGVGNSIIVYTDPQNNAIIVKKSTAKA